ncbi:MAG: ACT domain-containing protein [Candidatus Hydrothermarchaeaceae archaeon]|jgi:predicted regulator of amino acid metabolism with ACT domain
MSISEATRKILARYPYLEEYMRLGIVNNRALARDIKEDLKRELGREVNIQSVVSAVRRHPVSKGKREKEEIYRLLSKSEVSLRYDVGAITILLDAPSSKIDPREVDEGLIMIRGIETLTIVVEERLIGAFKEKFKDAVINSNKNLASVIVKSPKEIADTPGVIAHLANILAVEKINVVEMMSSYTETWFIVDEKDALKTVEAMRQEIKRARK